MQNDKQQANELYASYRIEKVYTNRFINAKSTGRGKIAEILVRNY